MLLVGTMYRNYVTEPIRSEDDYEDANRQLKHGFQTRDLLSPKLTEADKDTIKNKICDYAVDYSGRIGGDITMVLEYIRLKREWADYKSQLKIIQDKKDASRDKAAATRAKNEEEKNKQSILLSRTLATSFLGHNLKSEVGSEVRLSDIYKAYTRYMRKTHKGSFILADFSIATIIRKIFASGLVTDDIIIGVRLLEEGEKL